MKYGIYMYRERSLIYLTLNVTRVYIINWWWIYVVYFPGKPSFKTELQTYALISVHKIDAAGGEMYGPEQNLPVFSIDIYDLELLGNRTAQHMSFSASGHDPPQLY